MIRRGTGEPLYVQLAALLRRQIDSGKYPRGGTIPSEDALAAEHGVSVHTIRRAMAVLRAEGLVEIRAGLGTRVAVPDDESDLPTRAIGRGARFTVRPATAQEQTDLDIPPGGRVLVERLGARVRVFAAEGTLFTTA